MISELGPQKKRAAIFPVVWNHAAHTNRRTLFTIRSTPKIAGSLHHFEPLLRSRTATRIARTPTVALTSDQSSNKPVVTLHLPGFAPVAASKTLRIGKLSGMYYGFDDPSRRPPFFSRSLSSSLSG